MMEYADLRCRNKKTEWDVKTRKFKDVQTELVLVGCSSLDTERSDSLTAYSQKVATLNRMPLMGGFAVQLMFETVDDCTNTMQVQDATNQHTMQGKYMTT